MVLCSISNFVLSADLIIYQYQMGLEARNNILATHSIPHSKSKFDKNGEYFLNTILGHVCIHLIMLIIRMSWGTLPNVLLKSRYVYQILIIYYCI